MATLRRWLPEIAIVCTAGALACLWLLMRAVQLYLDRWDVSRFVLLLVGGFLLSLAAFAANLQARRDAIRLGAAGAPPKVWSAPNATEFVSTTMLLIFTGAMLFTQVGPVRTLWHALGRRAISVGMARDLPGPPAQPPSEPVLPSAP